MSSLDDIRKERIKKKEILEKKDLNPYPADTGRTHSASEALSEFDKLSSTEGEITLAGRVMSKREHGKSVFADIFDGTDRIQVYLKTDEVGEKEFSLFQDTSDVGDFIEVSGTLFWTKKQVKTLLVSSWKMLSKSLKPPPEEFYGFKDEEERFRKRYLDILMNPEVRDMFEKKSAFWRSVRGFLEKEGFLEIETPTLELTTGGAEATPFKTYHRDFDLDVYLRISVGELWQKRLMAAGIPKTFEIGRVYRNEGSSPEHLQEFTNMEFYAAFLNFDEGKELVKNLYRHVAENVFGTMSFETRGFVFDLSDSWEEVDYVSTVEDMTGVNVLEASEEDMKAKLSELEVSFEGQNRERMTDSLWKYCRKQIPGPAFLINHPKLVAPLSKEHPDNPRLTKTFQVLLAGSEVGRAHAELNDPIDQRRRFEAQAKLREEGDSEAMMEDEDFVEMLEYGMPPTFGFGTGDRLFSFMVDKPIRETQIFPLMKPKGKN